MEYSTIINFTDMESWEDIISKTLIMRIFVKLGQTYPDAPIFTEKYLSILLTLMWTKASIFRLKYRLIEESHYENMDENSL